MTRRVIKGFAFIISIGISAAVGFANSSLDQIYPKGIKLGMTADQVRNARGQAILMPNRSTGKESYNLAERLSPFTFAWYYIRRGKLAGFMRTTMASHLDVTQRAVEEKNIVPKASDGFVKDGESEALRAGAKLDPKIIKIVHWKSNSDTLRLFTVNSKDELSVIAFQPSLLSWNDFFVGVDLKDKLEAERKRISKALSEADTQKGTRSSAPPSAILSQPTTAATPTAHAFGPAAEKSLVLAKGKPSSFPIVPVAMIIGVVVFLFKRKGH